MTLEIAGLWAPVAAVVAALLQMAAYTGYRFFYESFGVSPDETGIEYSTLLVRSALQLVLLFAVVVAVPLIVLVVVGLYGYIGLVLIRLRGTGRRAPIETFFHRRAGRYGLLPVMWLAAFLATAPALLLTSSYERVRGESGIFVFVLPCTFVLFGEHAYLRMRRQGEPSLLDLVLSRRSAGLAHRVAVMAGALLLGRLAGDLAWSDVLALLVGLVLLDAVGNRIGKVEVLPSPSWRRRLTGLATRRTRNIVLLLLLVATPVAVVAGLDRLVRASGIGDQVQLVLDGGEVQSTYGINPFLLAQPKASRVEVEWVSQAPAPAALGREGVPVSAQVLTYFGQANGTAVFYDPSTREVIRMPSEAIAWSRVAG